MGDLRPHERSMDSHTLLNTRATEWSARAERADEAADEAAAEADRLDSQIPGMGKSKQSEALGHAAAAERHRARAELAATKGQLLMGRHEHDFHSANQELIGRMSGEGRVVTDDYPDE